MGPNAVVARVRPSASGPMRSFSSRGPLWSRWSTLLAGWRRGTRDSARQPPVFLGRLRTSARCRRDTRPTHSGRPGSIPAASTFNNNFNSLLHDRPPKSQERPNGRVRGRALLPCPPRWVSARQHGASWEGHPVGVKLSDHVGVMVHIADGDGRSVSGGYGLDGFKWARFPLRRRRKQSDWASRFRRQALCNDLRVLLEDRSSGDLLSKKIALFGNLISGSSPV